MISHLARRTRRKRKTMRIGPVRPTPQRNLPFSPNPATVTRQMNEPDFAVRRTTGTGGIFQLNPNTGFNSSGTGLTSGFILGLAFTGSAVLFYNPTIGIATSFAFGFPNSSQYLSAFDQFRIREVRVTGWFQNDSSSTSSVTTGMPLFYTAVDYDNSVVLGTNASSLLTYSNAAISQASAVGRPAFERRFTPRASVGITNSATTLASYTALSTPNMWYDSSYPNLPSFGMFVAYETIGANLTTTIGGLAFVVDVIYEFKSPR